MKVRLSEIRKLVQEEYLRGVPEFLLRDITKRYMESLRALMSRHIESTTKDSSEARIAMDAANETLKSLEENVNQLLEDHLWEFVQKT